MTRDTESPSWEPRSSLRAVLLEAAERGASDLRSALLALLAAGEQVPALSEDLDSLAWLASEDSEHSLRSAHDSLMGWGPPSERLEVPRTGASGHVLAIDGRSVSEFPIAGRDVASSLALLLASLLDGRCSTLSLELKGPAGDGPPRLSSRLICGCAVGRFALVLSELVDGRWSESVLVGSEDRGASQVVPHVSGRTFVAFDNELWRSDEVVDLVECFVHGRDFPERVALRQL